MDPSTVQAVRGFIISSASSRIPTCEGTPEDWRPKDWSPEDCCRFREDALKPVVAKDVVVSSDGWRKCLNDKWCWVWLQSFWMVDFRVTSSRLIPRRNTFESAFYIFMIWFNQTDCPTKMAVILWKFPVPHKKISTSDKPRNKPRDPPVSEISSLNMTFKPMPRAQILNIKWPI